MAGDEKRRPSWEVDEGSSSRPWLRSTGEDVREHVYESWAVRVKSHMAIFRPRRSLLVIDHSPAYRVFANGLDDDIDELCIDYALIDQRGHANGVMDGGCKRGPRRLIGFVPVDAMHYDIGGRDTGGCAEIPQIITLVTRHQGFVRRVKWDQRYLFEP